jgi:hypothetical protein
MEMRYPFLNRPLNRYRLFRQFYCFHYGAIALYLFEWRIMLAMNLYWHEEAVMTCVMFQIHFSSLKTVSLVFNIRTGCLPTAGQMYFRTAKRAQGGGRRSKYFQGYFIVLDILSMRCSSERKSKIFHSVTPTTRKMWFFFFWQMYDEIIFRVSVAALVVFYQKVLQGTKRAAGSPSPALRIHSVSEAAGRSSDSVCIRTTKRNGYRTWIPVPWFASFTISHVLCVYAWVEPWGLC